MAYGTSTTKRIIWTEPSGQVAVLYPIEAIENCIKDVPDGLSYHIVEDDDIPKNTFFERAWKIVDGKIEMDIVKARDVHRENIRIARQEKLAELDIEFQRALESSADTSSRRHGLHAPSTVLDASDNLVPFCLLDEES